MLDHVAPVRIHVEDQPAAIGAPVVPARPLAWRLDTVEHPPAELELEGDDASEEAGGCEMRELAQSREVELVLDGCGLHAPRLGGTQQRQPLGNRGSHGLFRVDVLARRDRPADHRGPLLRCGRVEENGEVAIAKRRVEVGGPLGALVDPGDLGQPSGIAADEVEARDDDVVADRQPAFPANGRQAVGDVLGGADAAARAVEDDADRYLRHACPPMVLQAIGSDRWRKRPVTATDRFAKVPRVGLGLATRSMPWRKIALGRLRLAFRRDILGIIPIAGETSAPLSRNCGSVAPFGSSIEVNHDRRSQAVPGHSGRRSGDAGIRGHIADEPRHGLRVFLRRSRRRHHPPMRPRRQTDPDRQYRIAVRLHPSICRTPGIVDRPSSRAG